MTPVAAGYARPTATAVNAYDVYDRLIHQQLPEDREVSSNMTRLATASPRLANPEADRTEYTYDKNGNLESQTDGEQNTTSYTYDELDRQASMTYPDFAAESRGYDPEGNLVEIVDPKSQVAAFTYDALNRETRREYRETAGTVDPAEAVASTLGSQQQPFSRPRVEARQR